MKRILLIAFLLFIAIHGFSQDENDRQWHNNFYGLYIGAGLATSYNYDVSPSVGFEFLKEIRPKAFLGFDLFYQTYSLHYDNEADGETHGNGISGVILRHLSSFVYFAPKFEYALGKRDIIHAYVTGGVGFNISGFDSLRKWDHSYNSPGIGNYDSTLDLSKNINTMLLRVSFGFKEYLVLSHHWRFTFTEDFGFIGSSVTKTTDYNSPSHTQYGPQRLSPGIVSLQIGIAHSRNRAPSK